MADLGHLKKLDPELYSAILTLEISMYGTFERREKRLSEIKGLLLNGKKKKAWMLLGDLVKEVQG